jgi:hypothetical protein
MHPDFQGYCRHQGRRGQNFYSFENLSGLLKSAFKNTSPVSASVGTLAEAPEEISTSATTWAGYKRVYRK